MDMSLSDTPKSTPLLKALRLRVARSLKPLFITLGWGTSLVAVTLWAVFQGLLIPKSDILLAPISPPSIWYTENYLLVAYYLMLFGVSFLAGLCIGDMDKTVFAFFGSFFMTAIVIYEAFFFPGFLSTDTAFREGLARLSINWTFATIFPIPLFLGLVASILGSGLQETILG